MLYTGFSSRRIYLLMEHLLWCLVPDFIQDLHLQDGVGRNLTGGYGWRGGVHDQFSFRFTPSNLEHPHPFSFAPCLEAVGILVY